MNLRSLRLPALIAWEILKRKKGIFLTGLILAIILFFVQAKFHFFQMQTTLSIGLIGTYQEHDLPLEVTKLLSVGLVEAGADGRIKPNLVSGWEVNHDATEFKFKLKDNLSWLDKTAVKAADINADIPGTTISYPDEETIQFKLKEPYSPLPSLLTKPVFKKGTLLGVGLYKVSKVEKSRIFITKLTLQPDNPKLPVIFIRFYPNEKVALTGFNLGEVQVLMGSPFEKLLGANPLVGTKTKTDYAKVVAILFQTTDALLSNRSLRQALAYQTPKAVGEEEANNPYPAKFWSYDLEAKKYLSNPTEAKRALERSKNSMPDDKLQAELILTTTPGLAEAGKKIINSWKDLGFDTKLRIESGIPQNFQALLITQSLPQDPDQYFLWHATQIKTNLTRYDSKRVDKDLEEGRKLIPESDRKVKYFDFQKSLLEDAPAVFLYFPKYHIVYLKKIEPLLDMVLKI